MIRWLALIALGGATMAAFGTEAALVCVGAALIVGALSVALRGSQGTTTAVVTRPLTAYEREEHRPRRWHLGWGIGLTFGGVFPFITFRRY